MKANLFEQRDSQIAKAGAVRGEVEIRLTLDGIVANPVRINIK